MYYTHRRSRIGTVRFFLRKIMIEYFKYRKELRRLNKELSKLSCEYDQVGDSYKGKNDHGHLSYLVQHHHEFNQWIEFYKTNYLKSKADRLLLPMPDNQDKTMYEEFDFGDEDGPKQIQTTKGIYHLKTLIREEQKSKREIVGFWFTISTGLIGAIIGLVSILKA